MDIMGVSSVTPERLFLGTTSGEAIKVSFEILKVQC